MATAPDYYELLAIDTAASTDAVRNAYKEKAMKHHPDRGGSVALWSQIQKAYDTLSDIQLRAVYDRTKTDAEGGAERQFAQKFGEGTFDLSDGGATRGRKGGMNILKQMEEVRKDDERVGAANRTAVVQSGFQMSHSAGFDAWLRNQKGMGQHGFYTADDLLRESKCGNPQNKRVIPITSIPLVACRTVYTIGFDVIGWLYVSLRAGPFVSTATTRSSNATTPSVQYRIYHHHAFL